MLHIGNNNDRVHFLMNDQPLFAVNKEKYRWIIISFDSMPDQHLWEVVEISYWLVDFIDNICKYWGRNTSDNITWGCVRQVRVSKGVSGKRWVRTNQDYWPCLQVCLIIYVPACAPRLWTNPQIIMSCCVMSHNRVINSFIRWRTDCDWDSDKCIIEQRSQHHGTFTYIHMETRAHFFTRIYKNSWTGDKGGVDSYLHLW